MKKRKVNHNLSKIKGRNPYTITEISELLEVHIRTVQEWTKAGLPVLEPNSKPLLVMGHRLIGFLKERMTARKKPLKIGQFFCTRCRAARQSLIHKIKIEQTGKRLGNKYLQVIIRGNCESCGNALCLLTSDRLSKSYSDIDSKTSQRRNTLTGCEARRVNTDIQGKLDL